MSARTTFFVLGQARRGGALHHHLADATLLAPARTAARYRLYSVADRFPALVETVESDPDAVSVTGELYAVRLRTLADRLLPAEPPELELALIRLSDDSLSLGMTLRKGSSGAAVLLHGWTDWLDYLRHR
ncbi:allophanate hydrolase-related protein [Acrocarpospora catenulata]|uniref:allophanate hydrolase-related protein n=1 Tax=Acrocarpospora catenulata TaxID=2836182 RepID=UPI001BD920FB|nr:gamma-glutamylcyclotransferase [Acrocarpospora catenulata]